MLPKKHLHDGTKIGLKSILPTSINFLFQSMAWSLNTHMGIWQTFHCCQHMACNEGYGNVCFSNFLRLAHEQTFLAAPPRSSLATFVHNLPGCVCCFSSPGSVPARLAACFIHYHTCRTGMDVNVKYGAAFIKFLKDRTEIITLTGYHKGCRYSSLPIKSLSKHVCLASKFWLF